MFDKLSHGALLQECFQAAKLAYRQFKLRVRKTLSLSHYGPESLEDAVVDYIVRNQDLYDVQASVDVREMTFLFKLDMLCVFLFAKQNADCVFPPAQDVISAMNVNPRISFPPEVDFILISGLIREVCKVAFAMQTLDPPLDLAFASDGELYNDTKLVSWTLCE